MPSGGVNGLGTVTRSFAQSNNRHIWCFLGLQRGIPTSDIGVLQVDDAGLSVRSDGNYSYGLSGMTRPLTMLNSSSRSHSFTAS
jgi:hypothetical protein